MPECIFCGARADSKGDAIPKWVQRMLLLPSGTKVLMSREFRDEPQPTRIHGSLYYAVRRRVCQACNTGWMSTLQRMAQPVVGSLIAGYPITLLAKPSYAVPPSPNSM